MAWDFKKSYQQFFISKMAWNLGQILNNILKKFDFDPLKCLDFTYILFNHNKRKGQDYGLQYKKRKFKIK